MHPYIPHTDEEIKQMLHTIGVQHLDDLYKDVPVTIKDLRIPEGLDEFTVVSLLKSLADKNKVIEKSKIFMGAGIYAHYIPQVVKALASRPEFVTAYTPYQAEVSQGTLQALFEYQTMICELTGMEVANSSMYDGASALAEAILMAHRINGKHKILMSKAVHPEYVQTSHTYASAQKLSFKQIPLDNFGRTDLQILKESIDENTCAVVIQYPNFFGVIEDLKAIKENIKDAVFIVVVEPFALSVLESPATFGADIVVGDGQPLGIPMNYGGPTVGFLATLEKHVRKMPGRLIGETKDIEGNTGYVMILQTREQHIRREKATSNICTNHALMAVTNAIFMSTMGPDGLREVAKRSYSNAHYLADRMKEKGFNLLFDGPFFNEFAVRFTRDYDSKWRKIFERGVLGPLPLGWYFEEYRDCGLACATEVNTKQSIDEFVELLGCDEL
ncbi:aminomethyl-transferring glycine dehydrogenase subunit GcvPA [Thermotoga profunda]|uniref:aminomethyl-transferring glycine dehydrogenase subunit GcvPA n=1 Tax=Thermotoga profunda TaxID=1508420 RepID=UPI0009E46561|nr:aminomethyl-transferring glycine dehydrogenase subunit GcvPA [Thermotoga profunda]